VTVAEAATQKLRRRGTKRSTTPNDEFPNASLSVRDVHLILRELESFLKRIEGLQGRDIGVGRRHAQKLVAKLYQVRWTP
jgi:hypothetical protein